MGAVSCFEEFEGLSLFCLALLPIHLQVKFVSQGHNRRHLPCVPAMCSLGSESEVQDTRIQNVELSQNFFSSSLHDSCSSLFESQYYPAINHASHRPAASASILDTRLLTLTRRLTRLNPHVQVPPQRLLYHWSQVRSHLSEKQSHNASSQIRPCRFRAPDRRLGY